MLIISVIAVIKDEAASTSSNTISLTQRGPPLRIEVSPSKEAKKGVSSADLINWMRNKSLCLSHMKSFTQFIRQKFGRFSVEKHAQENIVEYSHQLDEYFVLAELSFLDKEGNNVTRKVPVVKDPTELVYVLHDKMELDIRETFLKTGIDAGHGSLKVCYYLVHGYY